MWKFAVVEIAGKQYLVRPGEELVVNSLGDAKDIDCDKVLLLADDQVSLGAPFIKSHIKFNVLEQLRGKKIRVAKFHAKANTRKVRGSKSMLTKVKVAEETVKKS